MAGLLIAIIYLAFISLGLPDSLLGAAWPMMFGELSVPVSYAGIISFIITLGTIISSLFSMKITAKIGAGAVTAISGLITALSLLGFALSNSFILIAILAIPYGLGAGAVDAALNHYVANNLASRHMNWLHCFWGVGAAIGPYIMTFAVAIDKGWRTAYGSVFLIQFILAIFLFITLPVWKKQKAEAISAGEKISIGSAVKIKGVLPTLIAFFSYCAFETSAAVWITSYLVFSFGMEEAGAAALASLYYIGITVGRFVSGFFADKLGDKREARLGGVIMLVGALMMLLSLKTHFLFIFGMLAAGFGGAPIYPAIIHMSPSLFGKRESETVIGVEMASAYTGSAIAPPIFGLISSVIGISSLSVYLALFALLTLVFLELGIKISERGKRPLEAKENSGL